MKTAAKKQAPPLSLDPRRRRANIMNRLKNDWLLYLLLAPVLAWYLIFCYAPMGGLVLAFKDYSFKLGIWDSPWIGLGNFTKMLSDRYFLRGLKNTLVFGIGGMAVVYVLVPFLDGVFRKLPARTLMVTACILVAVFAADQLYSVKYPNEGKGITDFQEVTVGKSGFAGRQIVM